MENTIANLQYVLKDHDVKEQPVIQRMIEDLVVALQKIMVVKRARWKEDEEKMEACPCGNCK
jgi:hypothetical protein